MAETFISGAIETGAPSGAPAQNVTGVTHEGAAYIAGDSEIWKSEDGLVWNQLTPTGTVPNFSNRPAMTSMGGWLWCMPMNGGVYASEDGVAWSEVIAPGDTPYPLRKHGQAVTFDDKIWLIGGSTAANDTADLADVWYSPDGVTWTEATDAAAFGMRVWHKAVAFNGKMYVIGGSHDLGDMVPHEEMIYTSTDGVTWTNDTPSTNSVFGPRGYFGLTVHNDALVLTGGGSYDGAAWEVTTGTWTSDNGSSWTFCGAPLEGFAGFDSMAFSIKRRLAVAGGTTAFWADSDIPVITKSFNVPDFASRSKVYVDIADGTSTGTGTSWETAIGGAAWLESAVNISTATADGGVILMKSVLFGHNRGQITLEGDHFSDGKTYAIVGGLDPDLTGTDIGFDGSTTINSILEGNPHFRFLGAKVYKDTSLNPETENPVLGVYNLNFEYPLTPFYLSSRASDGGSGDGWLVKFDFQACSFNNGVEPIWADQFQLVPSQLNLTDCDFTSNTAGSTVGGGAVRINANAIDLNATGCLFHNNKADGTGGAISLQKIGSEAYTAQHTFTFTDCTITSNSTWKPAPGNWSNGGGFMYLGGGVVNAKVEFIDSVISKNVTGTRGGGVVRASFSADEGAGIYFDGCTVTENGQIGDVDNLDPGDFAGGGVFTRGGYVSMKDSVFEGNYAGMAGLFASGGVLGMVYGGIEVEGCEFRENYTDGNGAVFGLFEYSGDIDTLTVKNSLFQGNNARWGGGVLAYVMQRATKPDMKFENNIFAYNQCQSDNIGDGTWTGSGTVFWMHWNGGNPPLGAEYSVDFTNCDFVGNKCPVTGLANYINMIQGPSNEDWNAAIDFRLENCLFASNVMNKATDGFPASLWDKLGTAQGDVVDHCYFYNTIDTTGAQVEHWYDSGVYTVTPTNCNIVDETGIGSDPQINNPVAPTTGAAIDGATVVAEDFRQTESSPLMNAGTVPLSLLAGADYLGVTRPVDSAYDIGAFEGLKPEDGLPSPPTPPEASAQGWMLYH